MMRIARIRAIVCMCVALTLIVASVGGRDAAASEADGRFIVIYVDGISLTLQAALLTALGVDVTILSLINALALKIPLGLVGSVLQQLLNNPAVAGVYDDIKGSAAEVTSITMAAISADPSAEGFPWGVHRISADTAQQNGSNGAGVTVAVLDSGMDCTHPDLHDNIASNSGFSAFSGEDPCTDYNGHGTHVAGIIAAALNQYGIIGVASGAKLMSVQVLDHNARAFCSDVIAGLQYVSKKGVRAVNMSFGFYEDSVPLKKAIERLYNKGMIMVASAGNCGGDGFGDEGGDGEGDPPATCDPSQLNMTYPAAYADKVIAVAATRSDDQMAYYSRFGPVDVSAPGGTNASEPILSTAPGGEYALKSGTSMAAAHVTGAVAVALRQNSKLSFAQVLNVLQATALDLVDPSTGLPYPQERQGAGLINVEEMLQALQ